LGARSHEFPPSFADEKVPRAEILARTVQRPVLKEIAMTKKCNEMSRAEITHYRKRGYCDKHHQAKIKIAGKFRCWTCYYGELFQSGICRK
jgi:hypothetical protein